MKKASSGLTVESFWLRDIVLFKTARFKFRNGITNIQAVNLNRPGRGSNYSGKSLLFTSLANAMLNTEPLLTKNVRTLQKDIFGSAKSEVGFRVSDDRNSYEVVKKKSKTTVSKNGKPQDLRTSALQVSAVQNILKTNEEEFFTLNYVDSRRPSTFQFGTSASRFEFFTNLFRLTDLDETRKWLRQQANILKSDQVLLDRVQSELKELGAAKELGDLDQEVKKLLKKQKELHQRSRGVQKERHLLEMYRMYRPLKDKHDVLRKELSCDSPKKEISKIDDRLTKIESLREKDARIKERGERRKRLQEELASLKLDDRYKEMPLKKLSGILQDIEDVLKAVGDVSDKPPKAIEQPDQATAVKIAQRLKFDNLPFDKLLKEVNERLSRIKGKIHSAKEDIQDFDKHFAGHAESPCPTCKTVLGEKAVRSVHKGFSARIESLSSTKADLVKLGSLCEDMIEWMDYEYRLENWRADQHKLKDTRKYDAKALAKCANIRSKLDDIPVKIEELFGDHQKEERQLRKQRERLQKFSHVQKQLEDFKDKDELEDGARLDSDKLKAEQVDIDRQMDKINARLPKKQAELDRVEEHNKRRKSLKKEQHALVVAQQDLPVYEALAEAHSTIGMKQFLVKKIAASVEKNLNHYAKLLYQEPYSFQLVVKDNAFDAIVTRNLDGKNSSSDIRRMSGAESRIFSLAFLLSVLPLIPRSRRLNFLILDEPEVNLDDGMLQIFRDVLLPELNKLIPSIIVISPKDELVTPSCHLITVVKQGSVSKLIQGKYTAANSPRFKKAA